MRKLGLQIFFFISLVGGVLTVLAISALLWLASDRLGTTAKFMQNTIEGLTLAQDIGTRLDSHHGQSLRGNIEDIRLRDDSRADDEMKINTALDEFEKYLASAEEGAALSATRKKIDVYLSESRNLRAKGFEGSELFQKTADTFNAALAAVHGLVRINVDQALAVERAAVAEAGVFKIWVVTSLVIVAIAISILLWLFHRYVYLPLMALRGAIRSFSESGEPVLVEGAAFGEVNEIGEAFHELSASLKRQQEARVTFISSVAHDLKNPLGAIQMSIELLDPDEQSTDAERRELLAVLNRQVNQLRRLVDDIMDTARIEGGRLELRKQRTDLREVVGDCTQLFSAVSVRHRISVTSPKEAVIVDGDGHRLGQVVNNILSNAIKYSPQGGNIEVVLSQDQNHARITVKDQGVGISDEDLKFLFQPFRRAKGTREDFPGAGLGLSTARRIIEAHDGRIEVQSDWGKGSIFTVILPLATKPKETGFSLRESESAPPAP